jgi:hypothetical protein
MVGEYYLEKTGDYYFERTRGYYLGMKEDC